MKIITTNIIHFILLLSIIFSTSCTRNVKEQKIVTGNAKYNFVFTGDSSIFKDEILHKLIDKYKTQASIYVISNDKLKELDTKEYDVIVIMNTCIANSPSYSSLETFIDSHEDKNKIILFVTANNTSWKYNYKGVDAITAASKSGNPESIVQEISDRIDGIITEK